MPDCRRPQSPLAVPSITSLRKKVRPEIGQPQTSGAPGSFGKRKRSKSSRTPRSPPQRREPVAEHDLVAGDDAALERDALALPPHLSADGVAGKDRPREPRLDAFEPLRPVIGALPQDRARRDAEACRAMQDGTLEAGGLGALGIGVERVLVAVEPVQKREIGAPPAVSDAAPASPSPCRRTRRACAQTCCCRRWRPALRPRRSGRAYSG